MKRIFSYSLCSLFGVSALLCASANNSNSDQPAQIECKLQQITPLSIHYPAHAHRSSGSKYTVRAFPHIPFFADDNSGATTSLNWSGYVAATNFIFPQDGSVHAVAGTWTVPTLTSTTDDSFSSTWVGIDGFASSTVEQIGTSSNWISGAQQNFAWFELFPSPPIQIVGFPVNPADVISARVTYQGLGVFLMTITNVTHGVTTTIPTSETFVGQSARNSAEWIVEAPTSPTGSIESLADFGVITFTQCDAAINFISGPIGSSFWLNEAITMKTPSNITKALPSALNATQDGFTVTWEHE